MADPLEGARVLVAGGAAGPGQSLVDGLLEAGAGAAWWEAEARVVPAAVARTAPDLVACFPQAAAEVIAAVAAVAAVPVVALAVEAPREAAVAQLRAAAAAERAADEAAARSLRRLALAASYRDDNTLEHTERVAGLAARMGRELGLDGRTLRAIALAAPLHDVGKIAVPDSILLKPGALTAEEMEVARTHALVGARILGDATEPLLRVAEQIARSHHERWDGGGYPDGLADEQIPLHARLVAVADVFDVLLHERPHKAPWALERAVAEIRGGAGSAFDPAAVRAFDALGPSGWLDVSSTS